MHPLPTSALIQQVIGCADKVHRHFGPGLLPSLYEDCLCLELKMAGLSFVRQASLPVRYKDLIMDLHFQIDLIVSGVLVVTVKAEDELDPLHELHEAQLLTWLRQGGYQLGLLLNFNAVRLADGVYRIANSGNGDDEARSPLTLTNEPDWRGRAMFGRGS